MTTATDKPVLTETMRQQIAAYFPRYPSKQAVVLPALHLVHEQLRCVSDAAIVEIAQLLDLSPAEVHDTLSFYGFYHRPDRPLGRYRCWVCRSLPCGMCGGEELLAKLCQRLGIEPGYTTPDGKITVEFAECLGGCDLAPCLWINGVLHRVPDDAALDALLKTLE